MNREQNFISIVVYVHNAGQHIGRFLHKMIEMLEETFEHSEIICVNDFSTDNSITVIKSTATQAKNTMISILNMSHFHGLEIAMNAGVDLSIGDFVFEFDCAILDFDKEVMLKVYHRALEGYDIVSASSDQKQELMSSFFYYVFDKFTNLSYKMYTESFRILSRRVINRINSMNKTTPYRKASYANCGLKTTNIKYIAKGEKERKQDKIEKRYRVSLAIESLILFTEVGYRFSILMTFLMMLIAVLMVIYSVIVYVTSNPVAGWTTTILFMSVAFFGLFGILTVIIKYLQILVNLVFKRKQYSFESIEKLSR